MIATKEQAQWKAPWRTPVERNQLNSETTFRNRMFNKLQKTANDFKNIIEKHWLHD